MDECGKSSLGYEESYVAMASYCYLLGLVILILEKRSNFVRFHAVQSTLGFGILTALWVVISLLGMSYIGWLPGLLMLCLSVYMMIKSYYGEEYKLPIIGNLAFGAIFDAEHEDLLAPADGPEDTSSQIYGGRL